MTFKKYHLFLLETYPFFHLEWLWIVLICLNNFKIENVHKLIASFWNLVYFLSKCQDVGQHREWSKNPAIERSSLKLSNQAKYIAPRDSFSPIVRLGHDRACLFFFFKVLDMVSYHFNSPNVCVAHWDRHSSRSC